MPRRRSVAPGAKGPLATEQGAATPPRTVADRVARVLKWIGGVTAVLSLVFALVQATNLVSGRIERGRRIGELLQVAGRQLDVGDYPAAWSSAAEAGGVDARNPDVRRIQEDVAMAWLRDASVRVAGPGDASPRSFVELVDPLVTTLDRGAVDATGARQADLLAHRGWADFLRGRHGQARTRDPARFYRAAIEADARNPFAHAMWGHWILWGHGARNEALDHFAAAIAGGRERPSVRGLQLAALRNDGSPESEAEVLRVVNAIRLEGGTLDAGTRRGIHGTYWFRLDDSAGRATILASLPPDVHLATYRWLFDEDLRASTREPSYWLHLAQLQEYAGDTTGALATFRKLHSMRTSWTRGQQEYLDAAVARGDRSASPSTPRVARGARR